MRGFSHTGVPRKFNGAGTVPRNSPGLLVNLAGVTLLTHFPWGAPRAIPLHPGRGSDVVCISCAKITKVVIQQQKQQASMKWTRSIKTSILGMNMLIMRSMKISAPFSSSPVLTPKKVLAPPLFSTLKKSSTSIDSPSSEGRLHF